MLTLVHPNYVRIIKLAFPIILANASVPLLGLADTATIGQTGTAADLGAIALAALIFNFVYWGFGFLRMGTTGFVSQAIGAGNVDETHALLFRSVLLGAAIGLVIILLQPLIGTVAIGMLTASSEIRSLVGMYFYIRIWGAPATLVTFALLGTFIGAGWTKQLLIVQLFLNGLNILLNVFFVVGYGLGVAGIALGTVLAEWCTFFFASYLLVRKMQFGHLGRRFQQLRARVFNKAKLIALVKVNGNIMVRTLALLTGFAWFANQGADFGDHVLAANHVLLQFVSLSAFFLDGYAHVAEMLTGNAYGARDKARFVLQVRHTTVLAGLSALLLAGLVYQFGGQLVPLLTKDNQVQAVALAHRAYAAIYIAVSFAAFQLDGVFIGVTKSLEMRNATVAALLIFIGAVLFMAPMYGNAGLWVAFISYVVARAIALASYYPRIIRAF